MRLLCLIGIMLLMVLSVQLHTPVEVRASEEEMTFYPDAHVETTSVDGMVMGNGGSHGWAELVAIAGTHSYDDGLSIFAIYIQAALDANTWAYLARGVCLFDTSGLPDDAVITSAVLTLYGKSKSDVFGILPDVNIYAVNPASNTGLEPGDYNTFGDTPLSDTPIGFNDWNTHLTEPGEPNEFELNEAGIAAIDKEGITKLGYRNANYDVSGTPPEHSSDAITSMYMWKAEKGEGYKPQLVVTYTTALKEPVDFSYTLVGLEDVILSWTEGEGATNTYIRGIRGLNWPENRTEGILLYSGNSTSWNITGLSLDLSTYSLSAWGQSGEEYSENYTVVQMGGEIVEIAMEFPTGIYVLAAAISLLLISFFLKSPLIYLAVIACMVGVVMEPAFKDLWFQAGCVLVMIWCSLAFYKKMKQGGEG